MAQSFVDKLNSVLNDSQNDQQQDNFRPVVINQNQPFLGRILPIGGLWPFAEYYQAWISLTRKDGSVTPYPVIIDNDPNANDKLGILLHRAVEYNNQHRTKQDSSDRIKLASGRYPLRIQRRATFLGVAVTNQNGQWGQSVDNNNHPVIQAFDISYGAEQAICALLKPEMPYMYNGKQLFNTPEQFITIQSTFPVSAKFEKPHGKGVGNWSASVQQLLLPPINFNYLEKDQNGKYKYVDDIFKERQPLMKTDSDFYQQVLAQISESYQNQTQAGATNPYTQSNNNGMPFNNNQGGQQFNQPANTPSNDLPFGNNQVPPAPMTNQNFNPSQNQQSSQQPNPQPQPKSNVDVVAGMTGQGMNNFTQSNQGQAQTTQATQPTQPSLQPQAQTQAQTQATQPTPAQQPQQAPQSNVAPQATTTPEPSQNGSEVPQNANAGQSQAGQQPQTSSQPTDPDIDPTKTVQNAFDQSNNVDDFLKHLNKA